MTKSAVKRKNSDIKKPLPAQTGVVYRHSIEVNQMNKTNLSEQPTELNSQDFLVGDVVVLTPQGSKDYLLEIIDYKYTNDLFRVKVISSGACGPIHKSQIRHATVAELNAKRRLTSAEQALAEVS
ncbi:hypothetical protein NRA66_16250 [Acinetobacter baumannii]|uniref:hypothetical protein n=2 Tax=Acinetobacter baumannii TaxID=470 RepID=UPI0023418760|nr:hypothetical protein [Acinetobacter baumannii]